MAVQPLIALMKCLRRMFNSALKNILKNAAQWQIPDAEGYAKALIEKNVLMRFNPLNMKLTRSIRPMAKRRLLPLVLV